ncbi:MAG: NUDIX domain-containing protein [Aeromicrobium erythreum]
MNEHRETRRTQRLGAYGVVVADDETGTPRLLLTRISPAGYPAGWWALPGGGVDHGESPHDAVVREVYEETGLTVLAKRLVDVHHVHTVAPGRDDRFEDYHGVHLLYAVRVAGVEPGAPLPTPHVVEVDGTTDVATWLPLDQVDDGVRQLLPAAQHALAHLADYR